MSIVRFENWNSKAVLAGYTTDYGGLFRYHHPEDLAHYEALGQSLGVNTDHMIRVHQYHTDKVLPVSTANGGEGILREGSPEGNDALITNTPGLLLCMISADCVPVFFYDAISRCVGLAHSGRTGTALEIAALTAQNMQHLYGAKPERIRCILGPHLCPAHHQVKRSDTAIFTECFSAAERVKFIIPSGEHALVDMSAAITISLLRAGLRKENIFHCGICTYEQPELFSWRRDKNPDTHILSFISLFQK